MKLTEMKIYLKAHGAEEGSTWSHGGLGGGELHGIEEIDGVWHTYFSERGSKNGYKAWPSEEEAVAFILKSAERGARFFGTWRD